MEFPWSDEVQQLIVAMKDGFSIGPVKQAAGTKPEQTGFPVCPNQAASVECCLGTSCRLEHMAKANAARDAAVYFLSN